MDHSMSRRSAHGRRLYYALASLAFTAVALSSCALPSTSPSGQPSAPTDLACGDVPEIAPADPDGSIAALPTELRDFYNGFNGITSTSEWEDFNHDGEIVIGLSMLALANPYIVAVKDSIENSFEEAVANGELEGRLIENILPDPATMTPADQIRGYQDLVRQGADVIILEAISPEALAPAVEEAGKQGIPTISGSYIPSPYAITVAHNDFSGLAIPVAEAVTQISGEGNVLIVRGVQGGAAETAGYTAITSVLAACPDVNIVGEVEGNFAVPVAKSAVSSFLASHPGEIDLVISNGLMGAGVYAAFEQSGRDMPVIVDAGAGAGSIAYWQQTLEADPDFVAFASVSTGTANAEMRWDALMHLLNGDGPLVNNIIYPQSLITDANLGDWVVEGESTTSALELVAPSLPIDSETMSQFFARP